MIIFSRGRPGRADYSLIRLCGLFYSAVCGSGLRLTIALSFHFPLR